MINLFLHTYYFKTKQFIMYFKKKIFKLSVFTKQFRKKVLVLLLIILPFTFFAQKGDTSFLCIQYKINHANNDPAYFPGADDLFNLEIGKNTSKYYSALRAHGDSLQEADIKSGELTIETAEIMNKKKNYYRNKSSVVIYNSYPKNYCTVRGMIVINAYQYKDTINIKWKLTSDTMHILGYNCNKASAVFRGRNYTAWFTPEIPIPLGPYKFFGLPGLVLKVNDSEGIYNWECVGLTKLNGLNKPITIEKNDKLIETSRLKYFQTAKSTYEMDYATLNASLGVKEVGDAEPVRRPKLKYRLIELE